MKVPLSDLRVRAAVTVLVCLSLFVSQTACSTGSLVKNADRVGSALLEARPVFQSLIDGGVITNDRGVKILARLTEGAADAKLLADAFRSGNNSDAVDISARLIDVMETLINQDAQLIRNPATRTTALAILAAADIALHVIADNLIKTAQANARVFDYAMAWAAPQAKKSVEVIREYAKKPKLRCRDARSGRFLKMEQCKAHPDTTVVERY